MFAAHNPDDLGRFFRGLTEYAFHVRLGVTDPPLVDYVSLLLVRFLRHDVAVETVGVDPGAAPVTTLLTTARNHGVDEARAEFQHIGDYTLFWSGLYPEALARPRSGNGADTLDEFRAAGKRAYWLVSTLEPDEAADEKLLFERLSHDYDLCVEGLAEVRQAWGEAA